MAVDMENFIVSETVGKEVVYSTPCFEDTYNVVDGPHTILEISRATSNQSALMSPAGPAGQSHTMKIVDGALDVVNGSLLVGAVFTPPPVSLVLGVMAGVGGLIQAGLSFFGGDGKPDPVEEKFKELSKKIKQLDEMTNARFVDMKSFFTEHQFSIEIISEIGTLKKYFEDCLDFHNEKSIENFRAAYEQHSPLNIGYILLSLLSQRSTNPLIMEMGKEKNENEAKFEKWFSIFEAVLGDLILIESFGSGLLKGGDSHDYERLWELRNELLDRTIRINSPYWVDFKEGLGKYLENHTNLSNAQKADELKKQLEEFETDDAFYVCVLDEDNANRKFYYYCPNAALQLIQLREVGNCNVFVYRSIKGNQTEISPYNHTQKLVESLGGGLFIGTASSAKKNFDSLMTQVDFRNRAFVLATRGDSGAEVRIAKCPKHEDKGPGWWSTVGKHGEKWIVGLP